MMPPARLRKQELYALDGDGKVIIYTWVYPEDLDFLKGSDGVESLTEWLRACTSSDQALKSKLRRSCVDAKETFRLDVHDKGLVAVHKPKNTEDAWNAESYDI